MSLIKVPVMQFEETDGNPNRFAKAYFSESESTTPVTVYQDADFAIPHVGAYVQADADGFFPAVYLDPDLGLVRIRVIGEEGDLNDPIFDVDPINSDSVRLNEIENGINVYYPVSFSRIGGEPPIPGDLLGAKIFERPVRIPADWTSATAGSAVGWQITQPADADMEITARLGTVGSGGATDIGTLTVDQTTGEWTWETAGNVDIDVDTNQFVAFYFTGADADAEWLDLFWTFVAIVTGAP